MLQSNIDWKNGNHHILRWNYRGFISKVTSIGYLSLIEMCETAPKGGRGLYGYWWSQWHTEGCLFQVERPGDNSPYMLIPLVAVDSISRYRVTDPSLTFEDRLSFFARASCPGERLHVGTRKWRRFYARLNRPMVALCESRVKYTNSRQVT